MGECLLHPKFSEILSYASRKHVDCRVVTNGGLLTDTVIESILNSSISDIYISLFTSDEDSFKMRRAKNIDYFSYNERIRRFISRKILSKSKIKISIGILNTKYCFFPWIKGMDNQTQIKKDIISLIKFIEDTQKQLDSAYVPSGLFQNENDLKIQDSATFKIHDDITVAFIEVGTWANQLLIRNGVKVTKTTKGTCRAPFEQLFVAWDGTCTCCCLDYDCSMKVGDANKEEISAIWNGERYRAIREGMRDNTLTESYCQTCRGKIDFFTFMAKADWSRLAKMLFSGKKLFYLLQNGWKRFRF
jgi:hypothetical protein